MLLDAQGSLRLYSLQCGIWLQLIQNALACPNLNLNRGFWNEPDGLAFAMDARTPKVRVGSARLGTFGGSKPFSKAVKNSAQRVPLLHIFAHPLK